MILLDEGNVIPKAIRDIAGKVTEMVTHGEFGNLLRIPAPSYIH